MNWYQSISFDDCQKIKMIFAKLTEHGWVIPEWITDLENNILERDKLKEDK